MVKVTVLLTLGDLLELIQDDAIVPPKEAEMVVRIIEERRRLNCTLFRDDIGFAQFFIDVILTELEAVRPKPAQAIKVLKSLRLCWIFLKENGEGR